MKNLNTVTTENGHINQEPAEFPSEFLALENPLETFIAEEIKPTHPAEPDLFARHEGIPAHDQRQLESARIVLIGGGGLNSWAGVALARSGAKSITVIDPDRADRTNLSRQFFYKEDLGEPKGIRLAKNLTSQAPGGATVTGIGLSFEEAIERFPLPADILVVGVDNNACRLASVGEARRRHIPAVFTMLSRDGMRCQAFLQGASPLDACLWCALPNLDPEKIVPCASAIISSCFLASAMTVFFVHRALMGWGKIQPFNWREADLSGMTPGITGNVQKRAGCPVCRNL
ncbi:MAG: ThiF family adenylyltransferase [Acidobacteriota bacterium]|nr:ThiF family adenylyltransferase [Acidobacteriota bacterium]